MAVIDNDKIAKLLISCAEDIILPRFQKLKAHEIDTKSGPNDLVTQADILSEAFLERELPNLYPGSIIVGEEGISQGRHTIKTLGEDHGRTPVWIIDPVDGTYNFVHGKETFGIMVACVINGVVQHAWIYDVIGKRMHMAEYQSGAFCNDTRLQVRESGTDISALEGYVSRKYFPDALKDTIGERMKNFQQWTTIGAAAHEYTNIAAGRADMAVYSRLNPWDHIPGSLIVTEAGGYIAKWDGAPYTLKDHYAGLIVTTSQETWTKIHACLFDGVNTSAFS